MVEKKGAEDGLPDNPTGTPYVDWALRLIQADPHRLKLLNKVPPDEKDLSQDPPLWTPLSVRIRGRLIDVFQDKYTIGKPFSRDDPPDVVVEPWQFFFAGIARPDFLDLVIYVRIGRDLPDDVKVIYRSPPVSRFELPLIAEDNTTSGMIFRERAPFIGVSTTAGTAGKTAVGIIDDGIGFLNSRFMRGTTSRFAAHWIMSDPILPTPTPSIAALAAALQTETEAEIYTRLAKAVYWPGISHRMRDLQTHGTHMLDLAAGADPFDSSDPVRDIELFGVQIRPTSYDDTSGAGIAPDLQRGLFFLWATAFLSGVERLLVNISLGITAGPKDGTSDVEIMIRDTINAAAFFGVKLEVFLPYGNSYQDQLAAELAPARGLDKSIEWQIQPDDLTAGYFEIYNKGCEDVDLNTLKLKFVAPNGSAVTVGAGGAGFIDSDIVTDGAVRGHVSFVPKNANGRKAHLVVALAPSRANPETAFPSTLLCPPGRWTLIISSPQHSVELLLQMQRDDRPAGVLPGARQAYFEGPNTREFDIGQRQHAGLGVDGPVVHRGSNSAYTEVKNANVTSVGGARVRPHQDPIKSPQINPASYTAMGADWSGGMPTCGAATEMETSRLGIRAAGTFSNGTARLSGTSTASATATRQALETALGMATAGVGVVFGSDRSRVGSAVILDNRAIRRRP